jgi:hypothetical protein
MSAAWRAITVGAVILLGVAGLMLHPIDPAGYRDRAVQAATGTVSAVRTVWQLTQAHVDGQVFAPYERVVLGDAREAVATAQREMAALAVPDKASAAIRDELVPLLTESAAAVGDAGAVLEAGDDAAVRAVLARLMRAGDDLESFVDGHR